MIASGLALLASSRRSVTADEFGSIWAASLPDAATVAGRIQATDVHPPAPYVLLHYWGRLAGYGDFAMRLPSLLFVLLSVGGLAGVLKEWDPSMDRGAACRVLTLCSSAPVLWVQAVQARYYALGTLAGLFALLGYLRWYRRGTLWNWVLCVVGATLTFHVHYLLAGLVLASEATHLMLSARSMSRRQWLAGVGALGAAVLLALPVVLHRILPLLTGADPTLAASAGLQEGIKGVAALPLVLGGHVFATLTGAVPFPWDFWITVPVALLSAWLLFRSLRRGSAWLTREALALVWLPFVLLVAATAIVLPSSGYFLGVFRTGHVAVLVWMMIGFATARIERPVARQSCNWILLLANGCSLITLGADWPSFSQSTPARQAAEHVRRAADGRSTMVYHPFGHGWGDPLCRYLPGVPCRYLGDELGALPMEEYEQQIAGEAAERVWVVKRNRFSRHADALAGWLASNEYNEVQEVPLQEQRPYDVWIKDRLKLVPQFGFATNRSFRAMWTVQRFERRGSGVGHP